MGTGGTSEGLRQRRRSGKHKQKPSSSAQTTKRKDDTNNTNNSDSTTVKRRGKRSSVSTSAQNEEEELSLWEVFRRHPLTRVTPFFLIPYLLYKVYLLFYLQSPPVWLNEYLPEVLHCRPAVAPQDLRQVLIVGSMSSGTTQLVQSLRRNIGLEMGHEDSNTQRGFVRDGTVSWFHAIRYLRLYDEPDLLNDTNHHHHHDQAKSNRSRMDLRMKAALQICGDGQNNTRDFHQIRNMGFHPYMYQNPKQKCSKFSKNMGRDACWLSECYRVIVQDYGCVQRGDCPIPFRVALFQVRHPFKVVESLTRKFCVDKHQEVDLRKLEPLLIFAKALFPEEPLFQKHASLDAYNNTDNATTTTTGLNNRDDKNAMSPLQECIHVVTTFVIRYHHILLASYHRGGGANVNATPILLDTINSNSKSAQPHSLLHDGEIHQWYRIEDVTPCDVGRYAGFASLDTVVHGPNVQLMERYCQDNDMARKGSNKAMETMGQEVNLINTPPKQGQEEEEEEQRVVNLRWKDLREIDSELELKVKELMHVFGYDIHEKEDEDVEQGSEGQETS